MPSDRRNMIVTSNELLMTQKQFCPHSFYFYLLSAKYYILDNVKVVHPIQDHLKIEKHALCKAGMSPSLKIGARYITDAKFCALFTGVVASQMWPLMSMQFAAWWQHKVLRY